MSEERVPFNFDEFNAMDEIPTEGVPAAVEQVLDTLAGPPTAPTTTQAPAPEATSIAIPTPPSTSQPPSSEVVAQPHVSPLAADVKPPSVTPAPPTDTELPLQSPAVPSTPGPAQEDLTAILKRYEDEIARLSGQNLAMQQRQATMQSPIDKPFAMEIADQSYVTDEGQLASVLASPETFNKFLNNFARHIAGVTATETLRRVPSVTVPVVSEIVHMNNQILSFWRDNSDLLPHRGYLGVVLQEVQAQHPEWQANGDITKALTEAAHTARERLAFGLKHKAVAPSAPSVGQQSPVSEAEPPVAARVVAGRPQTNTPRPNLFAAEFEALNGVR